MAPTRQTAGSSNGGLEEQLPDLSQGLAAANAEIERLRGLLAAQETPSSSETLNHNRLADVLQVLTQRLTREESPIAPTALIKLTKLPDPPILSGWKGPHFRQLEAGYAREALGQRRPLPNGGGQNDVCLQPHWR